MKWVGRGRDEIKALIKGACLLICRMNGESSKSGDLCGLQCAAWRILQETCAEPPSLHIVGDREARDKHNGHRMACEVFDQALRCILKRNLAEDERVVSDHTLTLTGEISLRRVGLLVSKGKATQ